MNTLECIKKLKIRMNKIEKDCLVNFFESISKTFEYIVMRNADELPFDNFSNDVDILIDKKTYKSFECQMNKIFIKHGFDRVERTSFHGIECYTFYNIKNEQSYSLKIDLFFNYEGGGVLYYNFEDVIKFKIENHNGISVFNPKIESYLTILKTLAAGGRPKEKYLKEFLKYNIDDNNELLDKCVSPTLKKYLIDIINTKKNPSIVSRKKIILQTLLSNIKSNPIKSFSRLFYHYKTETVRAFKKQYIIVLVGPDGSGKTTLIDMLESDSINIFRSGTNRFKVFHHRPHVLPNIAHIFKKEINEKEEFDLNFNPHSENVSNPITSLIKLIYYAFDYILGYLIKLIPMQRENKFIIFDRYFFDFIVDQKRSAIKINKSVAILIYKLLIPKPNQVFFIKVDAQKAHDRKKELPVKSIEEINGNYDLLSKSLKNFDVIYNDDLHKAYNKLRVNFIKTISSQMIIK
jgi:thymidylate kinase